MEKKIVGDIFIVPNPGFHVKELLPFAKETTIKRARLLAGINLEEEDYLIEVWATSPQCDNWTSVYGGFQSLFGVKLPEDRSEKDYLIGYFPKLLPVKLFKGKKEGDTIVLHCPEYNITVELTLNQLGYRYGRFGKFEEVLKKV